MLKDSLIRKDLEKYGEDHLNIRIEVKENSWFMKILSWLLFFNRRFMNYITTIGKTIYFPQSALEGNDQFVWQVLAHEYVHAYDGRGWRFFHFAILYISPQIFALGFVLAFFVSWWFLLFLLLAAPLPSYGRYYYEMRGYATTMAVMKWTGSDIQTPPASIVNQFVSSYYYWMWPFRGHVESSLQKWIKKIDDGTIHKDIPILVDVKQIIDKHMR